MQATLAQARPFVAAKQAPARPSAKALVVRAAAGQQQQQPAVSRRALAALLAAAPALLPASRALALLPDDDDEELIEKAKANRKARLASERATEAEYKRSAGYVNRADEKDLIKVQKAVNGLAKSGSQLEAGDMAGAASTLSAGWVGELASATADLSATDAAKGSAAALLSSLGSLKSAAKAGSAKEAKQSFVAAVGALEQWVGAVGISGSIKGL